VGNIPGKLRKREPPKNPPFGTEGFVKSLVPRRTQKPQKEKPPNGFRKFCCQKKGRFGKPGI